MMAGSPRILRCPAGEVHVHADSAQLSLAVADQITQASRDAILNRGVFSVALAGGSTPRAVYTLMAEREARGEQQLHWDRIHVFFGDERHVPPTHPDSNFRMAREALLNKVPLPADNLHRIRGELFPHFAAESYEADLRSFFHVRAPQLPRFDLILLGLGADGHTASLFPRTQALGERHRLVRSNRVPQLSVERITLTLPVLNAAAEVVFIVSGAEKAPVLAEVLNGHPRSDPYPAQLVRPTQGRLTWLADEAAASRLR